MTAGEQLAGDAPVAELTPTQAAIWAGQRLHPDSPLANMGKRFRIAGAVDPTTFVDAFDAVVRECETLRMRLSGRPGSNTAVVEPQPPRRTEVIDLGDDGFDDWATERMLEPIDATDCVYDSVLLRHAADDWSWFLDIHHVATDAWASMLVFEATVAAYRQLEGSGTEGQAVDLDGVVRGEFFAAVDALPIRNAEGDGPDERAAAWASEVAAAGPAAPLELFGRRGSATTAVERTPLPLAADLGDALDAALAEDYRSISRELALLTIGAMAASIVVHRLDGRPSTLVGVPVHHRSNKTTRRLAGPLMEIYPLAVTVIDGETHAEMFARVLGSVTGLLRRARPGERPDVRPEVAVNVVTARYGDFAGRPCTTTWVRSAHADPDQMLGLQLFDYSATDTPGTDLTWELEVNDAVGGDRLPNHLAAVIEAIVRYPDAAVGATRLLTDAETSELALLSPDPRSREPLEPVHEAIRRGFRRAPGHTVVQHGERSITAATFDDRADRVAAWLQSCGVTPGDAVGLRMPRSIDVLVGLHGVLRAGAAFVMLDAADPPARHDFVVEDAGIVRVLDELPPDVELDAIDLAAVELPQVGPEHLAYVLYTSGSTGAPKGVPISHEGLADYLRFAVDTYAGDRPPVVPLHSSLVFDLTITSLFLSMLTDGLLIVVDGEPFDALSRIAADDRFNFLKATPSQLELFVRMSRSPRPLDTVVVGGEAFRRPGAERMAGACRPGVRIFNEYGPTEAVVGCMIHEWDPDLDVGVEVPIGRACDGAEIRILDPAGQPSPPGSWGELFVRRPGMATEYLNRQELSAERFVELEAERPSDRGAGRPWYRTGDRARVVRPGVAEYGGRMDDQMKVSGIRLEPAEVEAALVELDGVSSALVRLWTPPHLDEAEHGQGGDTGGAVLVAWYVADEGTAHDPDTLRRHLRDRLPPHAVPAAFVPIAEMPLAASAKADPGLLPSPASEHRAGTRAAPLATATERLVAEIWREALGVEAVGATDDFFDLGGASLDALVVVAAIYDRTGVDLVDAAVFHAPTVRSLAEIIDGRPTASATTRSDVAPTHPGERRPRLSPGEEAMLFEYGTAGGTGIYNVARTYRLRERTDANPIDVDRLHAAFLDLVALHEPLHTAYDTERTLLQADAALSFVDHGEIPAEHFVSIVDDVRAERFDLDTGPLVRVHVGRTGPRELSVLLSMHHISADASTLSLLWRQVGERYTGAELPALDVSYADYADQIERDLDDGPRQFWLRRSADRDEPARIALEGPSPAEPDGYVWTVAAIDPAELGRSGATPFAEAMAVASTVFAGLTGRADVEFGISASTKAHARAAPLVGYFLNTLPVSVPIDHDETFEQLVARASAELDAVRPHRAYPFASTVRDARAAGFVAPDASLMFAFDQVDPPTFPGAEVDAAIVPSGIAVADATLFTFVHHDRVEIGIEYRGSVLDEHRARQTVERFAALLESGIAGRDRQVRDLVEPATQTDLTGAELVEARLVLDRFLDRVAERPDDLAVIGPDGTTTTFRALADAVCHLAGRLVGASSPLRNVAVIANRDVDVVVGMLAAQFAGAAYVPIDPSTPVDRRMALLATADVDLVLVDSPTAASGVSGERTELIRGPEPDARADEADVADGDRRNAADELRSMLGRVAGDSIAYTIFTSGSTGTPKAVEVTHANLAASTAARDGFYTGAPQRFLVTSSIGFDSSLVGLAWPLATGGTIVMPGDDAVHDVDRIVDHIDRFDVSHVLMVPSLYQAVLDRLPATPAGLRVAIVAGEACPPALVAQHSRQLDDVELVNEYGPTETTVWAAAAVLHRSGSGPASVGDRPVPIGTAIPGGRLRVADDRGRPVWTGAAGELLIAGPTVATGYRHDDAATAERFVEIDGVRWYRSGDRVRATAGELTFLGRLDDQLNVGGTRLEPGEIEAVIASIDGVRQAAVVAVGAPPMLVAAVEVDELRGGELTVDDIRSELTATVPAAARPRRILIVESLPRSSRGKVDRRAVAELPFGSGTEHREGAAPTPGVPVSPVLRIWREVLDVPMAGDDADFFESGGDSLAAVALVAALENELDRRVPVAAILTGRTPAGVADALGLGRDEHHGGAVVDPILMTTLRPGVAGGSLVVMTPSWDDVFGYQALAEALPDDVRVVALAHVGSGHGDDLDDVVSFASAAADRCAAEIGSGRVALVGWSAGGLVAMELARRLADRDVAVDVIGLIDTYFPGEERHLWSNRWWKYKSLLRPRAVAPLAREVGVTLRRRGRAVIDRIRLRHPDGTAAAEAPPFNAGAGFSARFPDAVFSYEPQPTDRPVVLYRASTTNPARTIAHWETIAPHLDDVVVAGRHRGFESIMAPDRVGAIADDLADRLG